MKVAKITVPNKFLNCICFGLMGKDCPWLTDADKAELDALKNDIAKRFGPSYTPDWNEGSPENLLITY